MIVVTGGAGFIGSNLIRALNQQGHNDILVVDDLSNGHQFLNLVDRDIADYMDKDDFLSRLDNPQALPAITAVLHQGACSTTTEWDGKYMMANNYEYSKQLLHFAIRCKAPFVYASSAAVYGASSRFGITPENEKPLNVYGYSKLLFDNHVRRLLQTGSPIPVAGLRYFNVYGPGEQHKGSMASVAWHFNQQITQTGHCQLFSGNLGYGDGEQRRDFVYVDDVSQVNLWLLSEARHSGIFNVGTGASQTFNEVADAVIAWHGRGEKRYIPFPDTLKGAYQSFTEADLSALRNAGYPHRFLTVEEGVKQYLDTINE